MISWTEAMRMAFGLIFYLGALGCGGIAVVACLVKGGAALFAIPFVAAVTFAVMFKSFEWTTRP